jgi:hypothetical protein
MLYWMGPVRMPGATARSPTHHNIAEAASVCPVVVQTRGAEVTPFACRARWNDHQQFALDTLGMTRFDFTADAPRVLDTLCDEVRTGVDGDKLLAQVRVISMNVATSFPLHEPWVNSPSMRARKSSTKWPSS